MASNSLGQIFRITTSGESHGPVMGVIIDGCPAGIPLDAGDIQKELDRRRPGQSSLTTSRNETDRVYVQSGVYQGKTTGAPILLLVPNEDQKSDDYTHIETAFRPSHADFTYYAKYGARDHRGGGRSSARETANWVAAGAVAKRILLDQGITIHAGVTTVGTIHLDTPIDDIDWNHVDQNAVRCPDPETAAKMERLILEVKNDGDTLGGVITCLIRGCPAGLGEPVFHKLHADLGHAMLSINASKGFEYGSGFIGATLRGSQHNDRWIRQDDTLLTETNHSGGIQGGITNGMPIYFRVAFKPISTLMQDQTAVNAEGQPQLLQGKGRHDPCAVPRAVPIVEALAALVLVDHWLMHKAYL